jgi:hypothetical protein
MKPITGAKATLKIEVKFESFEFARDDDGLLEEIRVIPPKAPIIPIDEYDPWIKPSESQYAENEEFMKALKSL